MTSIPHNTGTMSKRKASIGKLSRVDKKAKSAGSNAVHVESVAVGTSLSAGSAAGVPFGSMLVPELHSGLASEASCIHSGYTQRDVHDICIGLGPAELFEVAKDHPNMAAGLLLTEEYKYKLIDFSDKDRCRHLFPDMRIKSSDGRFLYSSRTMLVHTGNTKIAEMLGGGNEFSVPFPWWKINIFLNWCFIKNIEHWDLMIAAIPVFIHMGEPVDPIVKSFGDRPLPWPIARLESLWTECKFEPSRLARSWLHAPCGQYKPLLPLPTQAFFAQCVELKEMGEFVTIARYVLPHTEVPDRYLETIQTSIRVNTDKAVQNIIKSELMQLIDEHASAPAVRRLIRVLISELIEKKPTAVGVIP